jgi:membrane-bound lytic murein transglycosylase B
MKKALFVALILACLPSFLVANTSSYANRSEVKQFIDELVKKDGFSREELNSIFSEAEKQDRIIELMMKPAEGKPWYQYRKIFLTDKRKKAGVEFWAEHADVLERASEKFGVDPEIIVSIIGVETFYGRRTGSISVLNALATLGFDYPPRSRFFSKELREYLILARDEGWEPTDPKGSYAGAMGMGQFIPSSYRHYAVDFSGDGKRDLWNSVDAIGSVANYFKRHGWRKGEGVAVQALARGDGVDRLKTDMKPSYSLREMSSHGVRPRELPDSEGPFSLVSLELEKGREYWIGQKNFYVITRYNHSPLYAMAVYQLSQAIKQDYKQKFADKS